ECAEFRETNHLAEVDLANLGHGGDVADHGESLLEAVGVAGSNRDAARVVDVDLGAGLLDDAADGGAALADEVADLVGGNLDRFDPRRVLGALGAGTVKDR